MQWRRMLGMRVGCVVRTLSPRVRQISRCVTQSDISAAIPAPAKAEITRYGAFEWKRRAAERQRQRAEADAKKRQDVERKRLGQVRIAIGAGSPARARSEAEI